jgi:hypothetical protein
MVVTVEDTTAPDLTVPGDVTVEQESAAGTVVSLPPATATDICDADVEISDDAPAIFPLGTTTVTFTAVDDSGNVTTGTTVVTVEDTTAPVIDLVVDPDTLWPPNHKMVKVTVVSASDICDADPAVVIDITHNENPHNNTGVGDGNTEPDWEIESDGTVWLRAERNGTGTDRIYTITVTATDDSGNESIATAEVTVPHDQGSGKGKGKGK